MKSDPINKGIDEKLFKKGIAINKNTPYHRLLGMNLSMVDKGIAELTAVVREEHENPAGNAHGGMIFSLFDTALGMAIGTLGSYKITSLDADINFIAPAKPGDTIKVTAKVVHLGKSTAVAEGQAYNQDGKLLAVCRETFFNLGSIGK